MPRAGSAVARAQTRRRRWHSAVPFCAALLPLLLSSCFTMALWGFLPNTERDPDSGREELSYEYRKETEWSWSLFALRVLATPITLVLDCITAPVQAILLGGEEDDPATQKRAPWDLEVGTAAASGRR